MTVLFAVRTYMAEFTEKEVYTREIVVKITETPGLVESRLERLKLLFSKGLISCCEYDQKRKEILSVL